MTRLLFGLAIAGLFGAGSATACDLGQNDASNDAAPMASRGAPVVTASKQATTKTAAQATAKPAAIACDAAGCNSAPSTASVAKPAVVACEGAGCP